MKSLFSSLFLLFTITTSIFAQEKVKLKVRVVNKTDGIEIVNPNVKVTYTLSENEIKLTTSKKESFYDVIKGAEVKVTVTARGFYDEISVFDTEYLYDHDVIEMAMNIKSSAIVAISIVDEISKENINASLQISFNGINSIQNTGSQRQELEFSFDKKGEYRFTASGSGYESKELVKTLDPEKHQEKITIGLHKTILTQNILFKNKESGQTVQPPFIVEIINVSDKNKTTIWNASKSEFEFSEGDTYNITVEKEGYNNLHTQIKPKNETLELVLEPKVFAPFTIQAQQEITHKPIQVSISVTDPKGGKTSIVSNSTFTPKLEGEYTFYFELKGYGRYELKRASQYKSGAQDPILSFNVLSDVEINLKIQDSLSHQAINTAKVSIIKEDNSTFYPPVQGNEVSFQKPPFATFKFNIEADGYEQKLGQIIPGNVSQNTVTVNMSPIQKIEYQEHEFVFSDARSGSILKKTQLLVLDDENNTVETIYNNAKASYSTHKIRKDKSYNINAKADGYNDLYIPLNKSEKRVELKMTPLGLREIVVSVYDNYTKEMLVLVDPKFELAESKTLPFQEINREYLINLRENEPAKLSFQQPGYPVFSNIITLDDISNDRLDIFIKKPEYPLGIKVKNELTPNQKKDAKAIITYLDGKVINNQFIAEAQTFKLESDPDQVLQIEINVPGFRKYRASNNREKLAMFEIEALLEPIPEPIIEPVITPQKIVISEVPVSEPQKSEIIEAPKADPALKTTEKMVAEKGRRYRLDGINFEQSQTTMLYGSELKLNELLIFMNENPKVKIEITGHTDKVGDERQNQRLSEFRARTVANWLYNHGIDSERITTAGMGSSEPIAPNDTEPTKAQNRRIEVMVIEN